MMHAVESYIQVIHTFGGVPADATTTDDDCMSPPPFTAPRTYVIHTGERVIHTGDTYMWVGDTCG